jgi:hypothetical protein
MLSELLTFLEGFMGIERAYSNLVYVVVLGGGYPVGWKTSWIDIVEKHHRYFYPVVGGGWPPPPNYMGFRYGGRLQSIRHVEKFEVVPDVLHISLAQRKVRDGKVRIISSPRTRDTAAKSSAE